MKTPSFSQIILALATASLSIQSLKAAPTVWNNAAGGNWSVGANWNTLAAPGAADDAQFMNTGTGAFATNDVSRTINSLLYGQGNQGLHTTVISAGQPLTISGAAANMLYVGTAGAGGSATLTPVTITGSGGALNLSGTGDLVIRQGDGTAGAHRATLDLSGLDTLTATMGRLLVGQATAGNAVNRPCGTLVLAMTNTITLSGASPQVMLQDSGSNANGSTASILTFGKVNFLNGDVMRLGGQKGNANMNFNGAFSLPSLKVRNADGASRVSTIDFGYNGAAPTTGNSTVLLADFSLGTVDLMANLVNIAQGVQAGVGGCTGTLTLGAGTFDVNDLEIGWGNATASSGATTGTINVNNNGLFGSGAVIKVNTLLRLGRTNSSLGGTVTGILNVNGGTVMANSIVSGGGVSTINVNSGSTLVISNTAGSLGLPISNFTLSDATLKIPALNGGGVVTVNNLTVSGSGNVINISSVPLIGSYPATFTLINYQNGYTAGTGPLSLGTLPSASPAYSGSLVDVGGGVIQLQLTAGPVAVLGMHWTGATDNNWDSSTYNWTFQGIATNYFDGSTPLFDDTTTQSNVFLATAVSPGSITVSNNTRQYSFVGSGNIAGAGTLTKKGSSSLIIANQGVNNIGTVVISGGTLQLGTNDVNGAIAAINITNNSALVVNRSGSLTLSSAIAGTGTVTKNGDGTLILSGANTYSGTTILNGGTLQIDGTSSGAGTLTTSPGTVLAGGGTVNGAVVVGGGLNPGAPSATGIFKANNGLTLSSGATATFDLSATDAANPAVNDSVQVTGNLTVNNNTVTVNISGTPQNGSSYLLFTYTGTLSGSFNPAIGGTHFTGTLDTNSVGLVYLNITGNSGTDLRWDSLSDTSWDAIATNWFDLNSSQPSVFFSGDTALLDDTAGVTTSITIAPGVTVAPSVLSNTSTNNSFTISGAGRIGGSASIVKSGLATLAINTANTFSGAVDVQAGTLQTGNASALGSTVAGTTVEPGATLDLNGQNLGGEAITISGDGVNGGGALANNGAGQAQALRQLILAGDATIGGTGLLGMNNSGGAASLAGAFSLTKVGPNQFTLQNAGVDANLANIDIRQGIIEFSGLTSTMGDAAFTNTVEVGATLSFSQNTIVWNKQFVFNGDGVTTTVNIGTSGNEALAGPVVLHGDCVFNVGGTSLTISNLSGDGGLIKIGGSPLILPGTNTYSGDTRINVAALRLNENGSISGSSNIVISAGATLSVTGRVDATFTLVTNQTLKGNGVINGSVIASNGSTVAPGIDAIGALTVSNAVTLAGTTEMELDPSNGTNDLLRCNSSITYGGTLNLVNLGGSLANGSSFKLFNAASYLGAFASITPSTPGPGQTWDISALGTSGTIKIAAVAQPSFTSISLVGSSLVMRGSNGAVSSPYYVLASTNLILPRSSWTRIATNAFDANGNFVFTNAVNPAIRQRFYLIQLP